MFEELSKLPSLYGAGGEVQLGKYFVSILVSMFAGYILSQIYRLYFSKHAPADYGIGNSFLLMMPAVTSIFIVIQYSLPLSLGLLGALSFVRFRTPIKRAEDISFILLAISTSLCCAVQYFHVAFFLIVLVTIYSLLRKKYSFLDVFSKGTVLVTLHDQTEIDVADVISTVSKQFSNPSVVSSQSTDSYYSLVFSIEGQGDNAHAALIAALRERLSPTTNIDLFYPGNELSI